jgi:flagellar hook-associated protein 1 FlgK
MSKISSLLTAGRRSLANSQASLQTVGHNIANKTTEGYSRQRVELVTAPSATIGNLQVGMGARTSAVTRTNNPWLEKQIQKETTNMGFSDARAEGMARVEQVYNEQLNKGLNQYMTDFFNAFRELSANPESLAARTMVREAGVALGNDFGRVVGQLNSIQDDLDFQTTTTIEEINQITKEIASLNERVKVIEVQGQSANDERDRRDLLLKKLGEKIDITWGEAKDGSISVTGGKSAILVSGTGSSALKVIESDQGQRPKIAVAGFGGLSGDVGEHITGGRLGGILGVREGVIKDLLGHVDNLAYTIAEEVNKAHVEGFDQNGRQGVLFFNMPKGVSGAGASLKVNQMVVNDVRRIAAAAQPGAPGDNTIANMIATVQNRRIMSDGTSTLDDYYNAQVGQVGTVAQRAVKAQESQKNIVGQLANIRESISGVSLDEEATKMIEFQKMYDASARLIRTADEMFDTLLRLKPM